ncbi:MAG: hypothetical protein V7K53_25840 [Nostoc sp.]|uniref:hypothetical protein n=1 Tax=Nostoc sp. TaxID=1180 RepID=UPI002FF89BEB
MIKSPLEIALSKRGLKEAVLTAIALLDFWHSTSLSSTGSDAYGKCLPTHFQFFLACNYLG